MGEYDQWPIPDGLSDDGRRAATVIHDFLQEEDATYHGGGGTFYTPQQWADRDELYGLGSLLIVTHDGGNHAPYFNVDYGQYAAQERLGTRLEVAGFWCEQATSWYSAVYKRS